MKLVHLSLIVFLIVIVKSAAGSLLKDPSFEGCPPIGQPPPPDSAWKHDWIGRGGHLCTSTAARTGSVGLWAYTGERPAHHRSALYQDFPAVEGEVFSASGYIRTPSGAEWSADAAAYVKLEFRTGDGAVLLFRNGTKIERANQDWTVSTVRPVTAPPHTAFVRFRCVVERSEAVSGVAVANFDDCSLLQQTSQPRLQIDTPAVGLGFDLDSAELRLINGGGKQLEWHIMKGENGDAAALSSTAGIILPHSEQSIGLTVDRNLLPAGASHRIDLTVVSNAVVSNAVVSNGGRGDIRVYLMAPPQSQVPDQPSVVRIDGYQVRVARRLSDGSLEAESPYIAKAVCWSPASIGTAADYSARQSEFAKWYRLDLQIMAEHGINTVYTFLDFGDVADEVMDFAYHNGIMVIPTIDGGGTSDFEQAERLVERYRNHPALLGFAIGNEWNINLFHGSYNSLWAAASANEQLARIVKEADPLHPTFSIHGELSLGPDQSLAETRRIINEVCPSVDVWGINVYRGAGFGDLFTTWLQLTSETPKPLFLSEFGTDSFHTTTSDFPIEGYNDEAMQASFIDLQMADLLEELSAEDASRPLLGCSPFEFCDEWWKVRSSDGGSPVRQDNGGFFAFWNPAAHPDGVANEEYFGLFTIRRRPKDVAEVIQHYYTQLFPAPSSVTNWSSF